MIKVITLNFLLFFLIFISGVVYAQFFYEWPKASVSSEISIFEIVVFVFFILILILVGIAQDRESKRDQSLFEKNRLTDEEKID